MLSSKTDHLQVSDQSRENPDQLWGFLRGEPDTTSNAQALAPPSGKMCFTLVICLKIKLTSQLMIMQVVVKNRNSILNS